MNQLTINSIFRKFPAIRIKETTNKILVNTTHVKNYFPYVDFLDFCKANHIKANQITPNGYHLTLN